MNDQGLTKEPYVNSRIPYFSQTEAIFIFGLLSINEYYREC